MDTIIIYDIVDDGLRTRIAKTLLGYGCIRIQKGTFYGFMNHNMSEKLKLRLDKMMHNKEGNIQFYPLCAKCFSMKESIVEIYEIKDEDVEVC
ncbi:MAG: CRISPR-associated endonuclease Cas2 [Methanotrichaceae archaeon]